MLILLRHGQSAWNLEDRFTGWTDVDLTEQGRREARHAGEALRAHGYRFDRAHCSVLRRAVRTAWIVLDATDHMWLELALHWRLNERHYGALQGLNKAETAKRYGADQVRQWRRSYAVAPPRGERSRDAAYSGVDPALLPETESLRNTEARVMPYWRDVVVPQLRAGLSVLVVAHGNSLRAMMKNLEGISDRDIEDVEIATGRPVVYRLGEGLAISGKEVL
jgi:2,3-bisphosphoglycerate-dependent phosphoglycerate mutase